MNKKDARFYFALFGSLTEKGFEISRRFFRENEDFVTRYNDVVYPENFYSLRDALSKDKLFLEDFEALNYEESNCEMNDIDHIILTLRFEWDIVSLGWMKDKIVKDFDSRNLFLIEEAIKIYGLTEKERSIYNAACCDGAGDDFLKMVRRYKQKAWERAVLFDILTTIAVDGSDDDFFEKFSDAIIEAEQVCRNYHPIDNYSYPESVLQILIEKEEKKKGFFKRIKREHDLCKKVIDESADL